MKTLTVLTQMLRFHKANGEPSQQLGSDTHLLLRPGQGRASGQIGTGWTVWEGSSWGLQSLRAQPGSAEGKPGADSFTAHEGPGGFQ